MQEREAQRARMRAGERLARCAAVILIGWSAASYAPAQPKISVDRTSIDLGIVYNGAAKKARVTIKNAGKEDLKIEGIHSSCGCTTAKHPKTLLKPGESDQLEAEFNSTGFRGRVTKQVTISSNDPSTPQTVITILAEVLDELEPVTPSSVVWLGSIPIGREVQHTFSFKNISGKPITVKKARTPSGQVQVLLRERTVMPAETLTITLKVNPNKSDYVSEQIFLETDSDKQSLVPLRVTFIGVRPG